MKPELQWEGEERYFGQAMTGYAMPGVELKIVDADDQDLPQNGIASGELVVRDLVILKQLLLGEPSDGLLRAGEAADAWRRIDA